MRTGVRFLSEISTGNMVTHYGKNLWNVEQKCGRSVTAATMHKYVKLAPVPEVDKWRINVAKELMEIRWNIVEIENIEPDNDELMEVLCSS